MYDEYGRLIYQYLQEHLPLIETALSDVRAAVVSFADKVFPAIAVIAVLMLLDRIIKRGDLI